MYVLFGTSIIALTIIIERFIYFARVRNAEPELIEEIEKLLDTGSVEQAVEACGQAKGIISWILHASLREWQHGCERMEDAVNFEGNRAIDALQKRLGVLSIIAQGAPLLGLLGTVLGMIKTFISIEKLGGDVDVSALAGGIWEALLTTAFGLIVAIPALFAYHYFESRVDRYTALIRHTGERLVALRRTQDDSNRKKEEKVS